MHCTVGISCCPWELRHRQPHLKRRVRPDMHITNKNMFKWNAFRFVYVCNLRARNSDLHATLYADADTHLSRGTDRLHYADTHLELCRGSDVADLERMDEYGDYVYPDA